MSNDAWLERLQMLVARFSYLGVDNLAVLNLSEQWGLYCYLSRLADS